MPLYEYTCDTCSLTLEKLQKHNAEPFTKCPECNEESLKKTISAATSFRIGGKGVANPTAHWGDMGQTE